MSERIHQLPIHLANQIAAGEVVERPASVLKELLENSLDAGSTQIEITLERGGIGCIRVQDNGIGICKEDLELALSPHATSKIKTLSDLEGVISYGFRGEALASIGSVSKLQLSSCVDQQEMGYSIKVEGRNGSIICTPIPKRQGTCVEVRDLFYNTPARRKFLKSEKTEMGYLEEVFRRIALSQPAVAFKFQAGDRVQKNLPLCKNIESQTRRVAKLCGQNFVNEAYYVQAESNGLKLTGWLGSPNALRSQPDLQYFYVNGRIVRDKVVFHAIRQAYQSISLRDRYPAYVLYFELDPCAVDVNVHPTKHEVRFREMRTVHAFLSYSVQEGLQQGEAEQASKKPLHSAPVYSESISRIHQQSAFVPYADRINDTSSIALRERESRDTSYLRTPIPTTRLFTASTASTAHSASFWENPPSFSSDPAIDLISTNIERPLLVLAEEFLLLEKNNELYLVDVKKIRKKTRYQELFDAYTNGKIPTRPLWMPKLVTLDTEIDLNTSIRSNSESLDWERLGFEWNQSGERSVLVRAVPEVFGAQLDNLNELFQALLTLNTVESCFKLIVEQSLKTQDFSLEMAHELVKKQVKSEPEDAQQISNTYKKVTIEQLRLFFNSL